MGARIISSIASFGYVGSVYIFPGARQNRNDMGVMVRRIIGVTMFSIVTTFNMSFNAQQWAGFHGLPTLVSVIRVLGQVLILYLPTLFVFGVQHPKVVTNEDKVRTLRDYVVGPVTEELVYRGMIISVYLREGYSIKQTVGENWLYFGFAHIHHALMAWLNDDEDGYQAIMRALVHFAMTGLFGLYAATVTVCTASVWPAIAVHIMCNYLGPPKWVHRWWYMAMSYVCLAGFLLGFRYLM